MVTMALLSLGEAWLYKHESTVRHWVMETVEELRKDIGDKKRTQHWAD
jgi:hypothetical protein